MTLHQDHSRSPSPTLLGTALAVAPVAVGCAAGLLLADRVSSRTRHGLASGLLAIGALATLPLVVDYVSKTIDSPAYRRGRQRRLQHIRDSGAYGGEDAEDLLLPQLERGEDPIDGLRS